MDQSHVADAHDLVNVREFVKRRGFGVVRIPPQERKPPLFGRRPVQKRKHRPKSVRTATHRQEYLVDGFPKVDARLYQNPLLGASRLEQFVAQEGDDFLEHGHVLDEVVGFESAQKLDQQDVGCGRESFQVVSDEVDVHYLEKYVAQDEQRDEDRRVDCVEVQFVGVAFRPESHHS